MKEQLYQNLILSVSPETHIPETAGIYEAGTISVDSQ